MKSILVILVVAMNIPVQAIENRIEPLLGSSVNRNGLEIQVESGGCTSKDSFAIKRRLAHKNDVTQLLIQRIEPDTCEANWPDGRAIVFSYDDLQLESGQQFQLMNPFGVHRVPDDVR